MKYSMVSKQMLITTQSIKQPGQSNLPGLNQIHCTQLGHRRDGSQPGKPREAQQEELKAQQTISIGKTKSTSTTTFQLRRAAVMEQSVFCAIREWK